MQATGKAQAKLIVLGEHFVVSWSDAEGNPHPGSAALALPLPELRTEVRIEPAQGPDLVCEANFDELESSEAERSQSLMERAVRTIAPLFGYDLQAHPIRVSSSCNFPISRGFGSSASFSIALARAFQSFVGASAADHDLRRIAMRIENVFHGKSSGLDTSVIYDEHPILFRNGEVQARFQCRAVDFVVVDGGPRSNCASVLRQTLELRNLNPKHWLSLARQINDLAGLCFHSLEDPQGAPEVAQALAKAQTILSSIGLTTPEIDRLLELGEELGALAGKLSGAGAGGALLFVTRPGQGQILARRLKDAGAAVLSCVPAVADSPREQARGL